MEVREIRQQEAVQAYFHSDRRSIINACPRFGKIKTAIEIIRKMNVQRLLLLSPRNDIFKGWESDFFKFKVPDIFLQKITFTSIEKIIDAPYDLVIVDEPHEMSINQQVKLSKRIPADIPILGLTGTLTDKTKHELYDNLGLDTCYTYSISDGVKDGILSDYIIHIHKVPLDNSRRIYQTKKGLRTEKEYFNLYDYISKNPKSKMFADLKKISIIQGSISKLEETRRLVKESDKRVLVFCGLQSIADSLFIPSYHSKSKEKEIFDRFCNGEGIDKLATIKMMQAGVTVKPINRGIINYMSGNPEDTTQKICRFLGYEYDNPEKKAEIYIVASTENFELIRMKTGLSFFDKSKIFEKNV